MIGLFTAIVAFMLGAALKRCDCCNRHGHAWRKPRAGETESAVCDRCGEPSTEVAA